MHMGIWILSLEYTKWSFKEVDLNSRWTFIKDSIAKAKLSNWGGLQWGPHVLSYRNLLIKVASHSQNGGAYTNSVNML